MIKLSGHSNGVSLTPFFSTRDISTLIEKHDGMWDSFFSLIILLNFSNTTVVFYLHHHEDIVMKLDMTVLVMSLQRTWNTNLDSLISPQWPYSYTIFFYAYTIFTTFNTNVRFLCGINEATTTNYITLTFLVLLTLPDSSHL